MDWCYWHWYMLGVLRSIVIGFVLLLAIMIPARAIEIRGSVTNLAMPEFRWTNSTFSGFYNDIDKNLGAEKLTFRMVNANPASATLSDQADANNNRGITYTTQAQPENFKFKPWGRYEVIGFLGDKYFAAYDPTITQGMKDAGESIASLYDKSTNRNLMTNEQLNKGLDR